MTRRRWLGLAAGIAILLAAAGVFSRGGNPSAARPAAVRPVVVIGEPSPPVDIDPAVFADPSTPTGRRLYIGPRGGVYHLGASGRKVYHPREDRR